MNFLSLVLLKLLGMATVAILISILGVKIIRRRRAVKWYSAGEDLKKGDIVVIVGDKVLKVRHESIALPFTITQEMLDHEIAQHHRQRIDGAWDSRIKKEKELTAEPPARIEDVEARREKLMPDYKRKLDNWLK